MPIEPVKIPQNVYIEDRIVGPLTLRQVIISAIGCGFSYAMFSMMSKAYGSLPLPIMVMVWVPGALSVIFAFVKFNDLTMFQMVLLTIERMSKAPVRVWSPRRGISITIRTAPPAKTTQQAQEPAVIKQRAQSRFDELSAVLDQQEAVETQSEPVTSPAEEPVPTDDGPQPTSLAPLPVNPNRITASPLASAESEDGEPRGRVSLFHDIHPAS